MPKLIIIAGCNGAGKSTYASSFLPDGLFSFDYDKLDFCYETNFDMNPIYWAEKFKENGFTLDLIFFCLENQDIARHRFEERTEFKGHFVNYNQCKE